MFRTNPRTWSVLCLTAWATLAAASGCRTPFTWHEVQVNPTSPKEAAQMGDTAPRELCKVVLPSYTIEPPDILVIDAIHVAPREPYRLRTFDSLDIQVAGAPDGRPIDDVYQIGLGGRVELVPRRRAQREADIQRLSEAERERYKIEVGFNFGSVKVAGLTVEEAEKVIEEHLRQHVKKADATVSLASMGAGQQITGQHLVGPDGRVTLGIYGSVSVVGLTIAEAKAAVERHLSQFLDDPQVSVDVFAYNSKVYYIVTQGAGMGDGVYRFPITGNETVLDAIAQVNGLQQVSSKRIWIARPTDEPGEFQKLPVSWEAITAQAAAGTNYQLLPGDRVFIAEDRLVAFDTAIAKITAPLERIFGFTLLGTGTATRLSGRVLGGGGNPVGGF